MIICNKCGAELNENSRFCGKCGARVNDGSAADGIDATPPSAGHAVPNDAEKYCVKCGARLPGGCVFCLICGTKAGEAPEPESEALAADSADGAAAVPASHRHSKRLVGVCILLCCLLMISAASVWFVQNTPYFGAVRKAYAKSAILYVTDDDTLKFKTPSMKEAEEIISGYRTNAAISGSKLAKASPNGWYIAYLNGYFPIGGAASGQLYLREFQQTIGIDESAGNDLLLAENVSDGFFFSADGNFIVYLTADGALCVTDYTETTVIDNGVTEIIDQNGTHVLYAKNQEANGTFSVFTCSVQGEGKTLVDDNILLLSDYTSGFDRFIYMRESTGASRDAVAYDATRNSRQVLASDIGDIISADARTFSMLHQVDTPNTMRYEDIIDDELARSDERINEPDLEDYPLLKEFYEKYGVDADYKGSMEYEDIVEESAQLEGDLDIYLEKRTRDNLREQIRDSIDDFVDAHPTLYDLHIVRSGEDIRLASGSYLPYSDALLDIDKNFAVWTSSNWKGYKKINLADYTETVGSSALQTYLESHISQNLYLQQFGRDSIPLYIGDGSFYSGGFGLSEKADGIYFAMGDGGPFSGPRPNACSLYYAPLQNGAAGNILLIDENVDAVGPMLTENRLFYYKDRDGSVCDLYLVSGTNSQRIGDNVSLDDAHFQVVNNNGTLIYSEYFDRARDTGSCFLYGKQNRQLSTDVHRVFYRGESIVYLLKGFKDGKAELYSFGNDGLTLIDANVTAVLE